MTSPRTPVNKFQRYRDNQRGRGLKMLRLWVANPQSAAPEGGGEFPGPRRGDIVIVAPATKKGTPVPVVIIQSDGLPRDGKVIACPLVTPDEAGETLFRLPVKATPSTGLGRDRLLAADRIMAPPLERCGKVIGRLEAADLAALNRVLAVTVGLAD